MKKRNTSLAVAALVAISLSPLGAHPDAAANEAGAPAFINKLQSEGITARDIASDSADRIRLADRLTMLTQRVAAASCALTSDVATDASHAYLEEAMHEFDIIIDALKNGNDALHIIGPEKSRRLLHDLDELSAEWQSIHKAIETVLADGHDVQSAHIIDDHNLKLLDLATVLSADISGEYSHPYEITQANSLLITISGRQRMLTQKMAKDACEIWTGYHAEEGRADLEQTMMIFENSLVALRDGMPAAGIAPAPTPEIEADIDKILARWSILRVNLDALLAGESLDADQKFEILHDFNLELEELDHLVNDYKVFAEQHHS